MKINDITNSIIGAAITVHRALGPGLLESAYQKCTAQELRMAGISIETEKWIPLIYKGVHIERAYRIDMIVEKQVIVEFKSVVKLTFIDDAQMHTYQRLTGCPVGLILNFNVAVLKNGIRRLILTT